MSDLQTVLAAEVGRLKVENDALRARLDAVRGVLIPISEIDWAGKWRVNRAVEVARG